LLDLAGDNRHRPAACTATSSPGSGADGWSRLIRRSVMMTAPPWDQNDESADDCENKPLRHFFRHPVCILTLNNL
jgi:hypothetical protein